MDSKLSERFQPMSIFLPIAEKHTYPNKSGSRPRRADAPSRIVIHTTETARLPGYHEGSYAPHFTIGVGDPGSLPKEKPGNVRIWQHISLDRTAFALKHNPGTVETNHMGAHCVQIECITYIGDQDTAGIVGNKGKFPKALSKALAGLVKEITAVLGDIDINIYPEKWSASGSYGEKASQRLSERQWENFNGICGHEHVPNNKHWDPGAFDIEEFVGYVRPRSASFATDTPDAKPSTKPELRKYFHVGDRDARVRLISGVVQALGYGELSSDDLYDSDIEAAVKELQSYLGTDDDGIWGPNTHRLALAELDRRLRWYDEA